MGGLETEARNDLVQILRPGLDLQHIAGSQLLVHERAGKALVASDEIDDDEVQLIGAAVQFSQSLADVGVVLRHHQLGRVALDIEQVARLTVLRAA